MSQVPQQPVSQSNSLTQCVKEPQYSVYDDNLIKNLMTELQEKRNEEAKMGVTEMSESMIHPVLESCASQPPNSSALQSMYVNAKSTYDQVSFNDNILLQNDSSNCQKSVYFPSGSCIPNQKRACH